METDYAIIGGGVVGLSVAHGLLGLGRRVMVLDEGDSALRASRGNFGLVWVQSKGLKAPAYARWTPRSASLWRAIRRRAGRRHGDGPSRSARTAATSFIFPTSRWRTGSAPTMR